MLFLADRQNELSGILLNRWRCSDPIGAPILIDDVGGISLLTVGTPAFQMPSMGKYDVGSSSVMGSASSYFSLVGQAGRPFSNVGGWGGALEGCTATEPNGNSFNLIAIPGQMTLEIAGSSVLFIVWSGAFGGPYSPNTVVGTNVLGGWPQHVVGLFDPSNNEQSIYVDGAKVATGSAANGSLGTSVQITTTGTTSTSNNNITAIPSTTGMQAGGLISGSGIPANSTISSVLGSTSVSINNRPTISASGVALTIGMPIQIAAPLTANPTQAAAQNIAVYGASLSAYRIQQHFQAFRQILLDPGHVRVYPQIGVYS